MHIVELHAHVFMDGIDYKKSVSRFKSGVDKAAVRKALSAYQEKGIHLVREGGDHFGACLYAKSIASEYGLTYLMPVYALFKEGNYGRVAGVPYFDLKEFQQKVLEAKNLGADFIKIMISGILNFDRFGVVSETDYTLDFVKELVHIAHEEGFSVMAHASGTERVRFAAEAGVDSLEHGYYIDTETMDILAAKKIVWVPTAVTSANLPGTGRFNDYEVSKIADAHKAAISEASSRGVLIGCGSDAGAYAVLHGQGAIDEYNLLSSVIGKDADQILKGAEDLILNKFCYQR
ncbi:MAG: amidohydrolase family protein [Parasporobacterium sp.]|nr:amidohydrolase family protein [Parasporobacterium sp.]